MFEDVGFLYNELIMDHNRSPRNFFELKDATQSAQGKNPICGDQVRVFLKIENNIIKDASFTGSGCAHSKASASLLTELVKGKTKAQAEEIFNNVREMMLSGKSDGNIGKMIAFSGIHQKPVKIKCAILPWHALSAALKNEDNITVSTEHEQT
jgi:nitrogen fixation NifU-like protein